MSDPLPTIVRLLRALGLLGIIGASVALGVQFVAMRRILPKYITANELPKGDRTLLLATIAFGAFVPLLGAGLFLFRRRERGLDTLEALSRLLAPAAVTALLPLLFCAPAYRDRPLDFLALLSISLFLVSVTTTCSLEAASTSAVRFPGWLRAWALPFRFLGQTLDRRVVALSVVTTAGVAYAAYTGYLTILDLHRLKMGSYDMGYLDNQMANSLHGHWFRNTILYGPKGGNSIAVHAHFVHILFLPLYALAPGSTTLLVLQAVLVGVAAVPLFLFAETLVSRPIAVAVAIGFLLFAPLHGSQFYDFHWLTISHFFQFFLYYGIATRRTWVIAVCTPLIFSMREDMSPGIAVLGLFLVLTGARPRIGTALFVSGAVWFALVKFIIMPAAGPWWFADIYKDLVARGEAGYGSIIRTLVANPAFVLSTLLTETKLVYALHLFAPLAFLPLRRPALALIAFPGFFFTLMTTGYSAATSIYFQYPGHWIPYLFGTSVLALRLIAEERGRIAVRANLTAAALGIVAHSYTFGVLFQPESFHGGGGNVTLSMTAKETREYAALTEIIRQIPQTASVMATEFEMPFITSHPDAFSAALNDSDADYVLIHPKHFLLDAKQHLRNTFARGSYGLLEKRGSFYLFKRGHQSAQTVAALTELGLSP